MNKKFKISISSIVFYLITLVLIVYAIYAFINSKQDIDSAISSAAAQGGAAPTNYQVLNYYMSNSFVYLIYGAILFAIGWILQVFSLREERALSVIEGLKETILEKIGTEYNCIEESKEKELESASMEKETEIEDKKETEKEVEKETEKETELETETETEIEDKKESDVK